jgi:dienelactone hydrolase
MSGKRIIDKRAGGAGSWVIEWIAAAAAVAIAALISGCTCASKCANHGPDNASAKMLARFESVKGFPNPAVPWEVYASRTDGPPVLLLHDILGPSPACLDLADRLGRERMHYKIYIPVLYGSWGHIDNGSFVSSIFANRNGWNFHTADVDQPALSAIESLCHRLRRENGGKRVLVIGNCATGGVAVALLRSPDVAAAVTSQPAAPYAVFFPSEKLKKSLDVSPSTLRQAEARAARLREPSLLGFHYYRDRFAPNVRLEEIGREFKGSFSGVELCEFKTCEQAKIRADFIAVNTSDSTQHTVLIDPDANKQAHYPAVFKKLVQFLDMHARD